MTDSILVINEEDKTTFEYIGVYKLLDYLIELIIKEKNLKNKIILIDEYIKILDTINKI